MFCDISIILLLIVLLIYVISHLDILPEAICGFIGLIDDILIVLIVFYCIGRSYHQNYAIRHSEEHVIADNGPQPALP